VARTTAIDGYEGFDSEGSLALQIGGDDVLHLRVVAPEGATHRLTDEQHQAVIDAVLAALGLIDNPLLVSLRAVLPYAESRAEDMLEACGELDGCDPDESTRKAVAAVDAAKALLASLDAAHG
jgi:ABC-type branched-subunit amino acid transport system substrate-binding protein